jgi:predicted RNA-binding protein YlxR (DUF448 family)
MKSNIVKKVSLRKCCITNELLPKKHLLRVVRTSSGEVTLDLTGKVNGRGVYIKATQEILQKAISTKAFERLLKTKINQSVYDSLKEYCK